MNPEVVDKLATDGPTQRGSGRLSGKISFPILGSQQYQPKFATGPHVIVRLQKVYNWVWA